MSGHQRTDRVCPHCGATDVIRLGTCHVCDHIVCERCGNTQFSGGIRRVCHDGCLHKAGDSGFTMIKIVK